MANVTPGSLEMASFNDSDLAQCHAAGANVYVRKEVDFTRFVDAVRARAHYWPIDEPLSEATAQ